MPVITDHSGINRILTNLPQKRSALAQKMAQDGEGHAKRLVLVDTGNAKSLITAEKESETPTRSTWALHSRAPYSSAIEFGTRYWAGQPYMRPAVELVNQSVPQEGIRVIRL
jgi:hypothetical protein